VSTNDHTPETGETSGESALDRGGFLKLAGLAGAAAALAPFAGATADAASLPRATAAGAQWARGIKIRFFAGGNAGDQFASVVVNGAKQAQADLGCSLDFVYSNWDPSQMVQQLRTTIAEGPDGIAMMGHPGDSALLPLAKQAHDKGVLMEYQNVDVPKVIAAYGGGYVGANLFKEGQRLGSTALGQFGLHAGQTAVIFGNFGIPGIAPRDLGIVSALENHGLKVVKVVQQDQFATNPQGMTPLVVGALRRNPNVKLVSFSGGQFLGAAGIFLRAAGKRPGQVKAMGFDVVPSVIRAMKQNWAQLTWVQQPFLQGYLPVLSLCLQKKWLFAPLTTDTGVGAVTIKNFRKYIPLVNRGIAG
jgi:simple sugar transport system substrate-binding protein